MFSTSNRNVYLGSGSEIQIQNKRKFCATESVKDGASPVKRLSMLVSVNDRNKSA